MSRRLAAIMAADVVGYSRMMSENESDTLMALHHLRDEILEPGISIHGGIVIKRAGDGWLVEFPSSTEAVKCAIAVQQKLADDPRIKLRIGLHIGDVVHDDDGDIYGDGVNIASRLENIARSGGIAISDQIHKSIDTRLRTAFIDSGEHSLKNITPTVHVWHWPDKLAPSTRVGSENDNAIPVILVDRFTQGGDVTDIGEEIRGELVEALTRRAGVKVATSADPSKMPDFLLNGRCRVSGSRCRLYLSMTVAANGETFWATKIDGDVTDIFDFLDEAVAKADSAIRTHINAFAGAIYASRPDETLTVQQLLAKAAFFFYHFDEPNSQLSRQTMNVAIAKAPENPMVLAMQAYAIFQTVRLAIERVEDIDSDAAMSFADKSVQLGPDIDFVFTNRGRLRLWIRRDHEGCFEDSRRALIINPNYHLAKHTIALANIFGGDRNKGIMELRRIIDQIPSEPIVPFRLSILAIGNALAGDEEAALRHARDGYERKPLVPIHAIAYAAAASGDDKLTGSEGFKAMVRQHDVSTSDATRFPFASESDTRAVAQMLRDAGVPE